MCFYEKKNIQLKGYVCLYRHRIEMILAVTMFLLYFYSYSNYLKIPKLQFEVYQPNLL
jgi:hypothetical protein